MVQRSSSETKRGPPKKKGKNKNWGDDDSDDDQGDDKQLPDDISDNSDNDNSEIVDMRTAHERLLGIVPLGIQPTLPCGCGGIGFGEICKSPLPKLTGNQVLGAHHCSSGKRVFSGLCWQ